MSQTQYHVGRSPTIIFDLIAVMVVVLVGEFFLLGQVGRTHTTAAQLTALFSLRVWR